MKSVQKYNLSAVNEALNELFVEDEDDEALRKSIDSFNNFNMIALASKLASRELLEFRRISAYVYRRNKKWSQSIELSKNDRMWKDCIDTADESADTEIIEGLLRFFCASETSRIYISSLHEVSRLWLRPPANAFNKQLYYDFFERSFWKIVRRAAGLAKERISIIFRIVNYGNNCGGDVASGATRGGQCRFWR